MPNGTATFTVCVEIVRVSGLRHGTIEVVELQLVVGQDTAKLHGPYDDVLDRKDSQITAG